MKLKEYGKISGQEIDIRIKPDTGEDLSDRWSPEYRFQILLHGTDEIIGHINVRIGDDESLEKYYGHVGYGIDEEHRGHGYAAKACRLAEKIFRDHSVHRAVITVDPDNIASRKTCEAIGASLMDILDIPPESEAYSPDETQKCRYEWIISEHEFITK